MNIPMIFSPKEPFTLKVGMYTFSGLADEIQIDSHYAETSDSLRGLLPESLTITLRILSPVDPITSRHDPDFEDNAPDSPS